MLNNSSSLGRGRYVDACGIRNQLIHVFAVGKNEFETSTKVKLGCKTNPNTGSSSAPVENERMLARLTPFLLPPTD